MSAALLFGLLAPEFDLLCRDNPEGVFELTQDGELLIMTSTIVNRRKAS
jgi:Uma2 family endonuclease